MKYWSESKIKWEEDNEKETQFEEKNKVKGEWIERWKTEWKEEWNKMFKVRKAGFMMQIAS